MMPPMPYTMYGAYPNQHGYQDFGEMQTFHSQQTTNGFNMGGSGTRGDGGHQDGDVSLGSVDQEAQQAGGNARANHGSKGLGSPRGGSDHRPSATSKIETTRKPQAVEN